MMQTTDPALLYDLAIEVFQLAMRNPAKPKPAVTDGEREDLMHLICPGDCEAARARQFVRSLPRLEGKP